MRVVLRAADGQVDVEVAVHDPATTVADLAAAAAPTAAVPAGLEIDGVRMPGATCLHRSGLRPGCLVTLGAGTAGAAPVRAPSVTPVVELAVVGGLDAGARHPLARGASVVGRSSFCSVVLPGRTTSNRHAVVHVDGEGEVALADGSSMSGTWIDGHRVGAAVPLPPGAVVAVGATLVRIGAPAWKEPAVLGPPESDGRRPLHRPPPADRLRWPSPVTPPAVDRPPVESPRFAWAAVLVPLVGGVVLARLIDPRLALFTLLGPVILLGQWLEDRRRHRRRGASAAVAQRVDLASFTAGVQEAGEVEARRRRALHPDPAALGEEIDAVTSGLWSRRPDHPGFAEVAVGAAPALGWVPPTTEAPSGPAAAVLADARLPHGSLATVALGAGSHLGIAGRRPAAVAVARWVVAQLAAHHGPADLRIAVVCSPSRAADWDWAAFLPHVVAPGPSGRLLLATNPVEAGELAQLQATAGTGPRLVIVVDGAGLADGALGTRLAGGAATVTIGASRRSLPGRCATVLELDGPDGWAQLAAGGGGPQPVLATGVDVPTARAWSLRLAGLADPEEVGAGSSPPAAARLLDLLDLDVPTPDAVRRRWARCRGAVTLLGATGGPAGVEPVPLDLVADGPHVLVAGTTGAGKSELLRSLVAGLAASAAPDRLAMLLVDYKGGAAFAEAARLPHVVGVVTDLGPEEAARALHSLEAELRRREAVLADLGVRDLAAHPGHRHGAASPGVEPLPRLVVVVDELAALVAELPAFLDDLVQLAARGRSLGLHLVLATQRPGSVVSAAVRTNCAVRCCLRVPDEADAVDIVGSPAPARLDRRQVGRAYLRRGAGDLVEVQVALVGGRPPADSPVTVQPATFGPWPPAPPAARAAGPSDLTALVDACCAAAVDAGVAAARPLWLAPLPASLAATDLTQTGNDVVVGLVDDPAHQRHLPLTWRPDRGPLVGLGTGPGPALALQAAARVLAARLDPGRLHIYGLDLAGRGLASLHDVPHVAALLRPGEHERLHRLVERLSDELARRQSAAGPGSRATDQAPPLVLVLVDGVAALRGALDGPTGAAAFEALERVVVDGAGLGLVVAVAADRLAALPGAWGAAASCRLAFRAGDPLDLLALGAGRVDQSRWPDGRCLDLASMLVAQVAASGWPPPARRPPSACGPGPAPVAVLPERVELAEVVATCRASWGPDGLRLPLGIDGRHLDAAVAHLRPGQPFLICGPPGAGRTTALAVVAVVAGAAGCTVTAAGPGLAERLASHASTGGAGPPLVVLVDDADRCEDADGSLAAVLGGHHPGAHLAATAPVAAVRSAFGHWSAGLRHAGAGLVLRPRSDLDADVLGIPVLPRWTIPLNAPGRGVLVTGGEAGPVQVALP